MHAARTIHIETDGRTIGPGIHIYKYLVSLAITLEDVTLYKTASLFFSLLFFLNIFLSLNQKKIKKYRK